MKNNVLTQRKYKYEVKLFITILLVSFLTGCSDDTPNEQEVKDEYAAWKYVNAFAHGAMSKYYLWKDEIAKDLDAWDWEWSEPKAKVLKIRYKENGKDVDRWTRLFDNYSEETANIVTTYGFEYALYQAGSSKQLMFVTTLVYPGSPAEKAGLKRGNLIVGLNNEPITIDNYQQLSTLSSVELMVQTQSSQKVVKMQAVSMYEDPVVLDSIYRWENKKVGYLFYNKFNVLSCEKLISVCKRFKNEGVSELILDLRYNSGGNSKVHQLLASMLAPEENVARNDVYLKRVHNKDYEEELRQKGAPLEQLLQPQLEWTIDGNKYDYDVSDANIGITKLYALVSGKTASASEAILIGLRPYLDIEIIGETTRGKYCGGYNLLAADWYQSLVDTYREEGRDFYAEHPDLADWKTYVADWGMYVINDYFTDKTGIRPDLSQGLSPDFKVVDAPFETYPLGDDREVLLHAALARAGKTDLSSRGEESRSANERYKLIEYITNQGTSDGNFITTH